jgi:RND superfamily putative drug exporter
MLASPGWHGPAGGAEGACAWPPNHDPRHCSNARPSRFTLGPIGRLGRYAATHFRLMLGGWVLVALVLGFFAPRVETALSGAGWQENGSSSVRARALIDENFHGLSSSALDVVVHSPTQHLRAPAFAATVAHAERLLASNRAVSTVVAPRVGESISPDGHTVVIEAGAARNANGMVAAANSLKDTLGQLGTDG